MTLLERLKNRKTILIGGHRGHLSDVRENTILNFNQIQHLPCSHYEVDVQLTKDEEIVIYHDMDLAEKTNLTGRIHDYTVAQLKASFEINTLEEVIDWAKEFDQMLAIEIKTSHLLMHNEVSLLAGKLAKILVEKDFMQQSFVFSVDFKNLQKIKALCPEVNLGLIVPFIPVDPVRLLQEMDAIIYLTYMDNLSQEIVDQVQGAGYFVDGSVINTQAQLECALEMGLDLVESDHPETLLHLLEGLK